MLAPLEQFKLVALLPLNLLTIDFSITNIIVISFIILFFFITFLFLFKKYEVNSGFFYHYHVPNRIQFFIEVFNKISIQLVYSNLNKDGEKYYPYVSFLFVFILSIPFGLVQRIFEGIQLGYIYQYFLMFSTLLSFILLVEFIKMNLTLKQFILK